MGNQRAKVVGGFRFQGSASAAEKQLAPWRARLAEKMPDARRETVAYQGLQIETFSRGASQLATVYAGDWFLVGNDLPSLQAVLDRVKSRNGGAAPSLNGDETFVAARRHLPAGYAAMGYARLDQLRAAVKLPALDAQGLPALRDVRSIASATVLEAGKMRDVIFLGLPNTAGAGELSRAGLSLTTESSFLYVASLLHLPQQLSLPDASATAPSGLPGMVNGFLGSLTGQGFTRADWDAAFASELSVVGDWPENTRVPALSASLMVKDYEKARALLGAFAAAAPEGAPWMQEEIEGVTYFSRPSANPMLPLAPTVALSRERMIAGLDRGAVEAAMRRRDAAGLGTAAAFQKAEGLVPKPEQSFVYLDLPLLYTRLDAALRPMLVMAAAFVPGVAEKVDLGKLPDAEVITRHLSPLVISQRSVEGGYLTEAVGPISLVNLALGVLSGQDGEAVLFPPAPVTAEETPTPSPSP